MDGATLVGARHPKGAESGRIPLQNNTAVVYSYDIVTTGAWDCPGEIRRLPDPKGEMIGKERVN
jgi:hypothetical protein